MTSGARARTVWPVLLVCLLIAACGSNSARVRTATPAPTLDFPRALAPTSSPTPTPTSSVPPSLKPTPRSTATPRRRNAPPPARPHVLLIMLENKGYAATLGSCSADPYLCSVASSNASVVGWTGVGHPSEPNYLAATSGSTQGCTGDTCFTPYTAPSLGGQLSAAGIPWTAYMESMPSACYTGQWSGGTGAGALYGEKHNPFVIFNDVLNKGCASHVLPYPGASGLTAALNGANAPDFVWVTPNQLNDMHSGSVQAGDAWLKANIAPVLASPWFTGGNSTVIVTMDEGPSGNAIPLVIVSRNASGKGNVSQAGNHYGTLRSIEEDFGLSLLGAAQSLAAGDVARYFG